MKDFPAVKIAVVFVAGILSQKFFSVPFIFMIIPASSLIVSFIPALREQLYRNSETFLSFTAAILILLVGNILAQSNSSESNPFFDQIYRMKNTVATGEINKIDLIREKELVFYVKTDSIRSDEFFVKDKIELLCRLGGTPATLEYFYNRLKPGNIVQLLGTYYKGREKRNPGEFDYSKYLKSKGITGILLIDKKMNVRITTDGINFFPNLIHQVRRTLDEQIKIYHSPETAGLLRGLLLADRREIDYETKTEFINAGVVHVLAVSGLHVGYIVLIFFLIFGRFNLFLRSVLTITGLLFFMFITGVPPSVFRAVLMASILIIAFLLNRSTNLINSISIAALIILSIDPEEIYNPGFQLSFAAVLSIGIIYPFTERLISRFGINNKVIKYILIFVAVSISAQLGTLPFTLLYFNKFSTIALLTNLVVIPAIGIIIGIAVFTLTISAAFPFIAGYFAAANDLITGIVLDVIRFSGRLDFSHLVVTYFSIYDLIVFYFFLSLLLILLLRFNNVLPKIVLTVIIAANIYLFSSLDDEVLLPEKCLSVFMIDIGQGDSFLIKFPNGETALIDAGNATAYFDNGERVIIPLLQYLGIEKIDYGFISHIDSDHYGGFVSLVLNKKIQKVYKPPPDTTLGKDLRFEKLLADLNIPVDYYEPKKLEIGNVNLYLLNFGRFIYSTQIATNDRSGLMKIVYGNSSFLFTGDLGKRAENLYAEKYRYFLDSDVLKVGHHGSKTSTSDEFLGYVSPEISLISAGINNSFGHPDEEILLRLETYGSNIYRTDIQKAILLRSDGETIRVINWE